MSFDVFCGGSLDFFPLPIPRLGSHVVGVIYRQDCRKSVNWFFENLSFQAKDALKALKFKLENVAYGGGAQAGIRQLRRHLGFQ